MADPRVYLYNQITWRHGLTSYVYLVTCTVRPLVAPTFSITSPAGPWPTAPILFGNLPEDGTVEVSATTYANPEPGVQSVDIIDGSVSNQSGILTPYVQHPVSAGDVFARWNLKFQVVFDGGAVVSYPENKNITTHIDGDGTSITVLVNGLLATTYFDGDTIQIEGADDALFKEWKFTGESGVITDNPFSWTGGDAGEHPIPVGVVDYDITGYFYTLRHLALTTEGQGSASASATSYHDGQTVTLTATPAQYNEFIHWRITIDGITTYETASVYELSPGDFDSTVVGVFTDNTYSFCRVDSDCPSGFICHNGICVPEVPTQANLPALFEIVNGRAVPNQHASSDSDCPPGHTCVDGVCVLTTVVDGQDTIVPSGYDICQNTIMEEPKLVNPPDSAETTNPWPADIEED